MVSTSTLMSLAMLKVNIDQGKDYLEYLRPFILQVLIDHNPSPVTEQVVADYLRSDYGLIIPQRTVQILLKRIVGSGVLKKEYGVFEITKRIPDPGITTRKAAAERHIKATISGLCEFRLDDRWPTLNETEATGALIEFLSEFSIPCFRAYLRGTALPEITSKQHKNVVLASFYVVYIQENDPPKFESFMVLAQGHMLANALLCPDLQNTPKSYKDVTFYFDTPLLVQYLGLEGEAKEHAIHELITLLCNLGGDIAAFSHTYDELDKVIKGAANFVDSPEGRGEIIREARRKKTTKSDLLLMAGQVDDLLGPIESKPTPAYTEDFQIDESVFENLLDDEIWYYNPRAKTYDVNSVRSIYVLREGKAPRTLEKCKAVLVTSNNAFARAAYEYGKGFEESAEISSVITAFSLANMAWLKAPMGAPILPETEFLAYCYAALQPSKKLLDKFVAEADRLEKQGKISERDHQLLRSSILTEEELIRLTLGDEAALTEETVTETLRRVSNEITTEEREKLEAEQAAHRDTQSKLIQEREQMKDVQKRLFWKCVRRAKKYTVSVSVLFNALFVGVLIGGIGLKPTKPILGAGLIVGSLVLGIAYWVNLYWGIPKGSLYTSIKRRFLTSFIKHEIAVTGLDLKGELDGF